MIIAKFYKKNSNNINFIYEKNNKLIGFSIGENGFNSLDVDLFKNIISSINLNDKCYKLFDYKGYELFYDPINELKHYIKGGKEDVELFLKYNSSDACLYKGNSFFKTVVAIGLSGVVLVTSVFLVSKILESHSSIVELESFENYIEYVEKTEDYKILKPILDNNLTLDEAIKYIYSSNLSEDEKDLLADENLLSEVIYYYNQGNVSNLGCLCLNNIEINYFPQGQLGVGVNGVYNPLFMNTINLSDDCKNDPSKKMESLTHEYIHLLQTDSISYKYLTETTADLISSEYYYLDQTSNYQEGVKTLKLLIEIIGPDPILKGIFGGDFSEFESILKDNLSSNDYKLLTTDLLKQNPADIINREHELREILERLYFSLYNKDITLDQNILYNILYKEGIIYDAPKSYLNKEEMEDYDWVTVSLDPNNLEQYVEKGILEKEEKYETRKKIDLDTYLKYKEEGKDVFFDNDFGKIVDNMYVLTSDVVYTLSEAVEQGLVSPYIKEYIFNKEDRKDGYEFVTDELGQIKIEVSYKNKLTGDSYVSGMLFFETETIKNRFNYGIKENEFSY